MGLLLGGSENERSPLVGEPLSRLAHRGSVCRIRTRGTPRATKSTLGACQNWRPGSSWWASPGPSASGLSVSFGEQRSSPAKSGRFHGASFGGSFASGFWPASCIFQPSSSSLLRRTVRRRAIHVRYGRWRRTNCDHHDRAGSRLPRDIRGPCSSPERFNRRSVIAPRVDGH